jgi:hypothetical protein
VPDTIDGCSVNDVAQESVTVRRHRDEVDALFASYPDQLRRWIAHRQSAVDGVSGSAKLLLSARQVRAVVAYFFRFPQVQRLEMPGGKSVGHVHEQQFGSGELCELRDVPEDGFIGFRVLDRDKDVVIHGVTL